MINGVKNQSGQDNRTETWMVSKPSQVKTTEQKINGVFIYCHEHAVHNTMHSSLYTMSGVNKADSVTDAHSEYHFLAPSSKLCQI